MNRYTAAGVLADMRNGRRVLVLSETQHLTRVAFAEVAQGALPGERVRRANGEEEIWVENGTGRALFASARSLRMRGLTVDVVVFDAFDPNTDVLESVMPNVLASPVGELMRP